MLWSGVYRLRLKFGLGLVCCDRMSNIVHWRVGYCARLIEYNRRMF